MPAGQVQPARAPAVKGTKMLGRVLRSSVRARLLRLALLLLIPGLAISGLLIYRTYDADRLAADTALRETARTLDELVDREFLQAEVLLRTLVATDELAGGDLPAFDRLARSTAIMGGHVVLLGRDGTVLVDTGLPQGTPPEKHPPAWAAGVPPGGKALVIGQLQRDPDTGAIVVPVILPIMAEGVRQADLALVVPASSFQALLVQQNLPAGWTVSIMDADFALVARSHDAGRFEGHHATAELQRAATDQGEAIYIGRSLEGLAVVFAFKRSDVSHWTVGVASPVAQVAETATRSFEMLVGLGSAAVIVGLLGALHVARGIARPIESAAGAARSLGEGKGVAAVPSGLTEADEVAAALANASAMLAERREALSELNRTLADRVEERTHALAGANAELEAQRGRLRSILDHMPIGVLVRSPDEQVFYANPAASELLGAASPGTELQALHAAVSGQRIDRELLSLARPDGRRVDVEVSAGPIHDEQGRMVLSVTTLQDVSARLEAEEARRRSQRLEAVGQLTGGVAHEFNNLLMALSGALDLLSPWVEAPPGRRMLDHASRAAERGARLTRQLLAFSRKQQLQVEPVDLNALVEGLTELLASTLGRTIIVDTALSATMWPARADSAQLELVLLNLAINARDAMPGGGRITITTACETMTGPGHAAASQPEDLQPGDYAVLRLADTGSGMSAAVLARAFEPFFTTKEAGRGTGLGLAQVLGVAQQLGGGVRIDSAPGRGTTVSVYLPRAREAAVPISKPHAAPPSPRLRGASVLLVDDDAEVRGVVRGMLEDMGAIVAEAGSGADALLLLRTGPTIDLVLADLTMPGMSGLDLARDIVAWAPDMPVVLMSGYGAERVGPDPDGIRAALQKPFRTGDLTVALTAALGRELAVE
jgi:signal transduction histidine kinase/CheY-like chemotaxis protein